MTTALTRKEWEEQMLVLSSAINQLQSNAKKVGLTTEGIAQAGFIAAVTFCRVEGLDPNVPYREAERTVPTRETMKLSVKPQ